MQVSQNGIKTDEILLKQSQLGNFGEYTVVVPYQFAQTNSWNYKT